MRLEYAHHYMEHFCTLFDQNFLLQGLALHASLRRHGGDCTLWVLCMDDETHVVLKKLNLPGLTPIRLAEVEDADVLKIKPTRTRGEYCWTLTPHLCWWLLKNKSEINRITYLDADLFFLGSPTPLFQEMEQANKGALITPHDHAHDNALQVDSLRGKYCVQFMPFTREKAVLEVLTWWREKCLEWCHDRAESGRFGDQKYLDQWTTLFPKAVHVLQDAALCRAPWNLMGELGDHNLTRTVFYHFHGLGFTGRELRLWKDYALPENKVDAVYPAYLDALEDAYNALATARIAWDAPNQFSPTQTTLEIGPLQPGVSPPIRDLRTSWPMERELCWSDAKRNAIQIQRAEETTRTEARIRKLETNLLKENTELFALKRWIWTRIGMKLMPQPQPFKK